MTPPMRAYKFLPSCHAVDDLRRRRLKIARIDELNDPFELWAVAQPDPRLRRALRQTKKEMAERFGVLCFSLSWDNPLLWSHYADRHHGVALGFDVDRQIIREVSYAKERPRLNQVGKGTEQLLLYTKYIDWQYEKEARAFTTLKDQDAGSGLYFVDFGESLVLREVIVGPLSPLGKRELLEAVGEAGPSIAFIKARLAFNSFKVVPNRQGFSRSVLP
jgi:DUF2971 family protein